MEYRLVVSIMRAASSWYFLAVLSVVTAACTPTLDADYWRTYQDRTLAAGLMRTQRAPANVTFSNADLIENFRQIIFYDEYVFENGKYREGRAPRNLEKFTGEVSYSVYGSGVSELDLSQIKWIAERISIVTGLSIKKTTQKNSLIRVMILNRAERKDFSEALPAGKKLDWLRKELATDLGGRICVVYPFQRKDPGENSIIYFIVIPNEISSLLRQSCIEEEFGQAFGPAADYEKARPSIFNDNEEFALFTIHDEMLFRVLYDPRLKTGMTEDEAMPIVRQIVAELRQEDRITSAGSAEEILKPGLKNSSSQK